MLDRVAAARCGRRGQSSPELHATRLWCSIFGGFSSYGTVAAWGSHLGNPRLVAVNEKGHTTVAMLSLTLAAVGAGSTDWMVLKTGKTWTTARVEGRRGVGSARTASQWRDNDGER
jgi:hypothetical protein